MVLAPLARGILHNERLFPDPTTFKPERWLSDDGKVDPQKYSDEGCIVNPWVVAFGYGRRICQGILFSEYGLWIAMATMLSSVEIRPKVDPASGTPLPPIPAWTGETARCESLPEC